MALIFLAVTVGLCVLAVAYFTGVVVKQDNARGLVGLTGAIVSFCGALAAHSYYREAMAGERGTSGSRVSGGASY